MSKSNIYILIVISIIFTITSCKCKISPVKESTNDAFKKLGKKPLYQINGNQVDQNTFFSTIPDSIASLTIIYGNEALDKFSENGRDGAVTLQTIGYARLKYESYFKKTSEYYNIIKDKYHENEIQYIVNKKVLKQENYGELLRFVEDGVLKKLKIIDSLELKNKYNVNNKKIGVILKSKDRNCK